MQFILWIPSFLDSMSQGNGKVTILLVLIVLCTISTILSLPTLYFFMAIGYFYGIVWGTLIAHILLVLSTGITFYIYRNNFRTRKIEALANNKWAKKINAGLGSNQLITILFTRAVYIIPYNVQNLIYALGSIKLKDYIIGTLLGGIPFTIINVSLGYFLSSNTTVEKTKVILLNAVIVFIIFIVYKIYAKKMQKEESIN